jgi:hypothetical protein
MATRKLRRQNNHTKKRKNVKKGGSIECVYDKSSRKLHITIARGMLDGNLSEIRTACEKAIKESSPEKPKASVAKASVAKAAKKSSSPENLGDRAALIKKACKMFGTSEDRTKDIGLLDGRRSPD